MQPSSWLEFEGRSVDTQSVMRYDVHPPDLPEAGLDVEGDLAFAAFSLAPAVCGNDVLEVRIGEHTLLEWCMACAVMRIFRPSEVPSSQDSRAEPDRLTLAYDRSGRAFAANCARGSCK